MNPVTSTQASTAALERSVREHPAVAEAAAVTIDEGGTASTLLYLTVHGDLTPRQLRCWLDNSRPRCTTPDEIHVVPEIPRDGDALDWSVLQRIRDDDARRRAPYVLPRTGTESYLVELWETLLELDRVGAEDDFFSLGGHSMLAVRIRRAIQRDRGVVVPAELLFINSVLADQARAIDDAGTPSG
jgi:hypothetical protein